MTRVHPLPKNSGNNPREPDSDAPLSFSPALLTYYREDKEPPGQPQDFPAAFVACGASEKVAQNLARNGGFSAGFTGSGPQTGFPL